MNIYLVSIIGMIISSTNAVQTNLVHEIVDRRMISIKLIMEFIQNPFVLLTIQSTF